MNQPPHCSIDLDELEDSQAEISDDLEFPEEEELSYQEIYGQVLESSPMIITVLRNDVDNIKRGVINAKHAARKKANYHGLPWDPATLEFEIKETTIEEERPFYVDLTISAVRRATVKIKRRIQLNKVDLEKD
jgi:hypothetical protein